MTRIIPVMAKFLPEFEKEQMSVIADLHYAIIVTAAVLREKEQDGHIQFCISALEAAIERADKFKEVTERRIADVRREYELERALETTIGKKE